MSENVQMTAELRLGKDINVDNVKNFVDETNKILNLMNQCDAYCALTYDALSWWLHIKYNDIDYPAFWQSRDKLSEEKTRIFKLRTLSELRAKILEWADAHEEFKEKDICAHYDEDQSTVNIICRDLISKNILTREKALNSRAHIYKKVKSLAE